MKTARYGSTQQGLRAAYPSAGRCRAICKALGIALPPPSNNFPPPLATRAGSSAQTPPRQTAAWCHATLIFPNNALGQILAGSWCLT